MDILDFFTRKPEEGSGLESSVFSYYIVPWIILLVVICLIVIFRKQLRNSKKERKVRLGITVFFVTMEIFYWFWRFSDYDYSIPHELATLLLQACTISFWFVAISNIINKEKLARIVIFLGILGPLMTLTIGPYTARSFDNFRYWHFYLSHLYTLSMMFYYLIIKQPKLTWKDFKISFVFMFIYAVIAIIINITVGTTNILYLYNADQTPFKNWFWGISIPTIAIGFFIPFYLFHYFKNEKIDGKRRHLHYYLKNNRTKQNNKISR